MNFYDQDFGSMADTKVKELMDYLLQHSSLTFDQLETVAGEIKSIGQIKFVEGEAYGRKSNENSWYPFERKYHQPVEEIALQTETNYWLLEGGRTRLKNLITGALRHVEEQTRKASLEIEKKLPKD